jgi:hypothetical protein
MCAIKTKLVIKETFLLLFIICIFCRANLFAQESLEKSKANNFSHNKIAVYVELGGNAPFYSFNFDTRISKNFGVRVGVSSTSSMTLMGNFLIGQKGKYFEFGGGVTRLPLLRDYITKNYNGTMSLMYRSQPQDGGFMWKIGFTPIFNSSDGIFIVIAGAGFGFCW